MAATTTVIAAVGAAAAVGGTVASMQAQSRQRDASEDAQREQERINRLQENRANLEASRRRRLLLRQAQIERAQSLAVSTAQGATGSSGQAGAMSSAVSQGQSNITAVNQGQEIGGQIYSATGRIGAANRRMADAGSNLATAQGIRSLGGTVYQNAETFSRVASLF